MTITTSSSRRQQHQQQPHHHFFLPFLLLLLHTFSFLDHSVILKTVHAFSTVPRRYRHPPPSISTSTTLSEAPVPFAGVGPRSTWTDMSKYNIPQIETILTEWTANIIPKNINENTPERIALGVENSRELFVDTIIVEIRRSTEKVGLGILLQEIKGGRSDGLGITVVSGLVEGGLCEEQDCDVMVGDSISSVSVLQTNKSKDGAAGLQDTTTEITAMTECLGYDATVEAISSLPPPPSSGQEQILKLTMKRIRRKPLISINLQYPPSQKEPDTKIQLYAGENLRLAMLVRGIKLNDPLAKRFDTKSGGNCGAGGLCRTCAVSVVRGGELLNPQKMAEEQMLKDDTPRWRLSCKAFVGYGMKEGEMTVQVNPRQW
uniref:2Fe-2S ferredoxin-type domain-containing protein n=1 Tax=Ditylum brightwellii TaxID=49249 RepID=A0A7S4RKK6_9STRA